MSFARRRHFITARGLGLPAGSS